MSSQSRPNVGPTTEETQKLVDRVVQELLAFRSATQLYPEDHPQPAARIAGLHGALTTFLNTHRELSLEVQGETLLVQGQVLAPTHSVRELATILRLHLIRRADIGVGVTEDEIRNLVRLLLRTMEDSIDPGDSGVGTHVVLERFQHFFDGAGPAEVADVIAVVGATNSRISRKVWERFSSDDLLRVKSIMERPEITNRLRSVQTKRPEAAPDDSLDFVSSFFDLLRSESSVSWDDPAEIESCLIEGLELIAEARGQKERDGALSSQLLAPTGSERSLSSHFRWRLLRTIFPDEVQGVSPRAAEDLTFSGENPWKFGEAHREEWGTTPPEELRQPLEEQFELGEILREYMLLNISLVAHQGDDPDRVREWQAPILRSHLEAHADPVSVVRRLVNGLPEESLVTYADEISEVLRQGDSSGVIDAIDGGDPNVRKLLLVRPPLPVDRAIEPSGPVDTRREILRRLLVVRDDFALTMVQNVLSLEDEVQVDARFSWLSLFQELVKANPLVATWLREHADTLFQPSKLLILFCIPFPVIRGELLRHLSNQTDARICSFLEAFQRYSSSQALSFLRLGLEFDSPPIRRTVIEGLAHQGDPKSLHLLEAVLRRHPEGAEVDWVCRAVARRGGAPGAAFLDRLSREKSRMSYKWSRGIRKAAKKALKESGGTS